MLGLLVTYLWLLTNTQTPSFLQVTMQKQYVKGFKLDREKIAMSMGLESSNDPEVDAYICVIVNNFNCEGYKFIGAVHKCTPPGQQTHQSPHLMLAIILEMGFDKEELKKTELKSIDKSIASAQPHVLDGLGVWELWG